MAEWTPALFLDPRSKDPVYLQIAHALMKEIHRGRFRPGDLLPGYRTLAEQVGVGCKQTFNGKTGGCSGNFGCTE